ncbi:hypothetical protein [Magnetospirillum molischianum]|uniref:Flagellar basal body-associated protein FliL n=1 Tax=Magnetospirillum molischianum DSM 120 TaxID=1150626 RepID=H8FUV4_MAGML|nr:hypothetical protein [Magnetospirillum molischianum]CCG42142.1 conserved hypothetical protein [Magnetospirillum molischianum DSM 120]
MIRVIFIVISLLLILAGVVGGLYFWGIDPLAKLGIDNPLSRSDAPPPAPPPPPPPSYVDFGLLMVPVIQNHEVRKQAEMIVRLEVDPKNKEIVARNLPRLQNAFLEDMINFLGSTVQPGQPLDTRAISRRLMIVADRTLGPGYLRNIVIENPNLK